LDFEFWVFLELDPSLDLEFWVFLGILRRNRQRDVGGEPVVVQSSTEEREKKE